MGMKLSIPFYTNTDAEHPEQHGMENGIRRACEDRKPLGMTQY